MASDIPLILARGNNIVLRISNVMAQFKSVSPIYGVRDTDKTSKWYRDVLGFDVVYKKVDGSYVVVARDGCPIHLLRQVRRDILAVTAHNIEFYVEVEDVDAVYQQALKCSDGSEISAIEDRAWGMREFQVKDPDGALLRIGAQIIQPLSPDG